MFIVSSESMKGPENVRLTNVSFIPENVHLFYIYNRKATKIKIPLHKEKKKSVCTSAALSGDQTDQEVSILDFLSLPHFTTGYT
jgi:hypothetical protein